MGFRYQFIEKGRLLTAVEREDRTALANITRIQRQFTKRFVARYHASVRAIGEKITANDVLEAARSGDPSVITNKIEPTDFILITKEEGGVQKVDPFTEFDLLLELILAAVSTEIKAMKRALLLSPQAGTGFEFAFDIDNPFTKPALQQATFNLVSGVAGNTKEAIRNALEDMFLDGTGPRQAAKELRDIIGLNSRQGIALRNQRKFLFDQGITGSRLDKQMEGVAKRMRAQRAEMISRTETLRVENQAKQDTWKSAVEDGFLDATKKRRWIAAGDERTDDLCFDLEALDPVSLDEPFVTGGEEFMLPPAHPMCLPGDAAVLAGDVTATSERRYDGDLVVIRTAGGKQLAATANHPILTDHGWVPASLLYPGCRVVCDFGGQWESAGDHDHQHVPILIEQVADSFRGSREMTATEVPVTPEHFHGDGSGSQIAVIRSNGLLRHAANSPRHEQPLQPEFVSRRNGPSLADLRAPAQLLERARPTGGLVSGGAESHPFLSAGVRHAHEHRIGPIPGFYTALQQPAADGRATDPEALCERLLRGPGHIAFDQILHVDVQSFHGRVYNMETLQGHYIAEGIVTHNCRCTVTLVR